MAYGIVKVDNITFDNGGSDQNVTVSGLYRATTSGVTVSGTIAATTVSGVTIIGSTTVSGATVTGTTANFTSGNFTNLISAAATMSGALIMANQQQVRFREAVGNGVNHIALQAPAIISADQTITLPDQTGTVVTTGDNGSVTSTMILDGTILNADINASAAIAGTKISPDFGSQTIVTTGVHSAAAGSATTPSIAFTGDLNTGIYSPGANQLAVATNGTGRLFVDANGRVGIGVSAPNDDLEIRDAVAAIRLTDSETLETTRIVQDFQTTQIINSGTGDIRFSNNGSERVRITSAGLVGIGTSSPAALLHLSSGANTTLRLTDTAGSYSDIIYNESASVSQLILDADPTGSSVASGGTSILLKTDGSTAMTIDSSQRVGIGTSAPGKLLEVSSSTDATIRINDPATIGTANRYIGGVEYYTNDSSGGAKVACSIKGYHVDISGNGRLQFATGNETTAMTIDGSQRVGIGTTSPGSLLHLSTDVANGIQLQRTGSFPSLCKIFNSGSLLLFEQNSSGISFQTGSTPTEKLRIDSSGRLLVGTSSAVSVNGLTASLELHSQQTTDGASASIARLGNDGAPGPQLNFGKSRSGALSPGGIVQNNDYLGEISFCGDDGTDINSSGAKIMCQVDGTPGANDMPGRLVFYATPSGSSSPIETMRLRGNGFVSALGVYSNTTAVAANVNVDSNGLMRRSTSSVKYKTDIETLQDSYADALLSCRPVWYRSTCENDNPSWGWWGFIAEEVAAIDPRLVQWKTVKVTYDENGSAVETPCNPEPEGVAYDRFVPHLLNLIKRQQQAIETLEAGNTDLLARVSALESA
jgi:hypothetical protein